jgi:hypothetical protein
MFKVLSHRTPAVFWLELTATFLKTLVVVMKWKCLYINMKLEMMHLHEVGRSLKNEM